MVYSNSITPKFELEELVQSLFLLLGDHEESKGTLRRSNCIANLDEIIDLEKRLMHGLSQTRMLKNTHANINRLPLEILAHIFSMLQPPIHSPPYSLPKPFYSWIIATQICRSWRAIAFSFPRLWNRINVRKPYDGLARMCIKYSARAPLKLYLTLDVGDINSSALPQNERDRSVKENVLREIARHSERFEELHISWQPLREDLLWEIILPAAPNLRVLSFLSERDSDTVLPMIFMNNTPKLQKITFTRISSWPWNTFDGLTSMNLYNQLDDMKPSMASFLDVLRLSPGLEELVLIHAGPDGRLTQLTQLHGPIFPSVDLPHLRFLELGDWSTEYSISYFLSHLIIPQTATRCIWSNSLGDLSVLLNISEEQPYLHIRKMAVISEKSPIYRKMVGMKGDLLHIHGAVEFWQYQALFTKNVLPNVEELVLCPTIPMLPSSTQAESMLGALPSLKILIASGAFRDAFVRLFSGFGIFNARGPSVMVRHLHTVKVFKYAFVAAAREDFDVMPLVTLCSARKALGCPIRLVVVEDCRKEELGKLNQLGFVEDVRGVYRGPLNREADVEGDVMNEMWRKIRHTTPVFT